MVAPAPQHMLRWCGQPFALVQPHSWGQGRDSLLPFSRPLASSFLRLSPARCSQPHSRQPPQSPVHTSPAVTGLGSWPRCCPPGWALALAG